MACFQAIASLLRLVERVPYSRVILCYLLHPAEVVWEFGQPIASLAHSASGSPRVCLKPILILPLSRQSVFHVIKTSGQADHQPPVVFAAVSAC